MTQIICTNVHSTDGLNTAALAENHTHTAHCWIEDLLRHDKNHMPSPLVDGTLQHLLKITRTQSTDESHCSTLAKNKALQSSDELKFVPLT